MSDARPRRSGQYLLLFAMSLVLAAGCAIAGAWQISRYHEKHTANTTLLDNNAKPAVPLDQLLSPAKAVSSDLRFRRIVVHGHYTNMQFAVRQRQVADQPAFLVLTPLQADNGNILLVVRGWLGVGDSATDTPKLPPPPNGEVTVTARIYPNEPASHQRGLPAGQVERINAAQIGKKLGTTVYDGYAELISQQPPAQPISGASNLAPMPAPDLSNPAGGASEWQHIAYVVQWFLFAALGASGPFILLWLDRRRGFGRVSEVT